MPRLTYLLSTVLAICGFPLSLQAGQERERLRVGIGVVEITPPTGFPMAGYYHERLAEGMLDPLKAKAIVFLDDDAQAAIVVCDLISISTDLALAIRQRAAETTGISESQIVVSATHSHTAPDYGRELYLSLGNETQDAARKEYVEKLIQGPVDAIAQAFRNAVPASLKAGTTVQQIPISFNRRFVMRNGTVQTWQSYSNPEVVRAAGPIDPEIGLLVVDGPQGTPQGILSSFALHLDTVGGARWSADYPHFIQQTLAQSIAPDVVSIFATGCCGDINHVDPHSPQRNTADMIGSQLGKSIAPAIAQLKEISKPKLSVATETVLLPLQKVTADQVERSVATLKLARAGEKVDFFDHVMAYKTLFLDQLCHTTPFASTPEHLTWGLSRSMAGVGEMLPVEVTVITLGDQLGMVFLPGEVFVELGLAIKQASPFPTTLVLELSNASETIYVPHRAAYAGGSYEVTNSALQPGAGEMLVETAISLLRRSATEFLAQQQASGP